MELKADTALVAYVPVPHEGYLKFFREYAGSVLYILDHECTRKFPAIVRHLPGIKPEESQKMIRALGIFSEVHILTLSTVDTVRYAKIIMPDEDVSHAFAKEYFSLAEIFFDGRWKLRWDWGTTQLKRRPKKERVISAGDFDRELMRHVFREAERSPDWWRQIGALLVKDGEVVLSSFNRHVPSEQSAYCYGDPRSNFEPGQCIDLSLALHAEAGIIAEAAKRGVCTEGLDLWVTTFPCPPCAHLCAYSGIKRLYYADGYALVAGAEVLQAKGVEIIRVEI